MSYAVHVLCAPEVAAGFSLAGVPTIEATAGQSVDELVAAQRERPDVGVVLMQQRLYDRLSEDTRRRLGRTALPMIVPFPNPAIGAQPESAEAYIVELLRQVVGYRVRLR